MPGPGLRTDNDARFTDSTTSPDVKEHQQVHDTIAAVVNQLGIVQVAKFDGQVLAWDAASQMFVPTVLGGDEGPVVQTSYLTAAPGTVFRIVYAGGWPPVRPSDRRDLHFDLVNGPDTDPAPEWRLPGDNVVSTSLRTADQAYTVASQAVERVAALEETVANLPTGGSTGSTDPNRVQTVVRYISAGTPGSSAGWQTRNSSDPFGVLFLSTNDPDAPPPNDPNLKIGDRWARHTSATGTPTGGGSTDGFNDGF